MAMNLIFAQIRQFSMSLGLSVYTGIARVQNGLLDKWDQ